MAFRIKDLMINIAPGAGAGLGPTLTRGPWCCHGETMGLGWIEACGVSAAMAHTKITCTYTPGGRTHPTVTMCTTTCTYSPVEMQGAFCGASCTFTPGTHPTITGCTFSCAMSTGPMGVPMESGDPIAYAEQLSALKVQLGAALAEIERQEKAVNESMEPQTLEDVEMLQGKLREAMAELEERKRKLQRG